MDPNRLHQEENGTSDPPPNGGNHTADSPPNLLIDYLASYVDSLEITEDDLAQLLQTSYATIVFTNMTETGYDYLQEHTSLTSAIVGRRNNHLLVLTAPQYEDIEVLHRDVRLPDDQVEIRSGSLVRFHPKHLREAISIEFDFAVEGDEYAVVAAITDTSYQNPFYLHPDLPLDISSTRLGTWVSKGEEYLVINREDLSILDYNIHDIDPQPEEHLEPDTTADTTESIVPRNGTSSRITTETAVLALALFTLLLVEAAAPFSLLMGVPYTVVGIVAFVFLFASMLYDDHHRAAPHA